MLGFTMDPYPCVRRAALEGLAGVCVSGIEVEDSTVVEGCFFRSVELLSDHQGYVRLAAIRAVSEWGRMLVASKQEGDKRDWSDGVFLQICSMVRDMNVGVRVEAFTALGKIAYVSEDILLQSLSKRVLGTIKEKQSLVLCSAKPYEIHASSAAGAFIHGLEDEFSEVQRAACISLRLLPVVSGQFAGEAVNILSYVLNDDSIIVRLEALKTIHHMATSGCLKMQEEHIDMLLGTLVDSSPQIRSRAINILGSVQFPDRKVSKLIVESLLSSLDMYPKSEAEIFRTLFSIGQNHGKYAVSIIEDFYHEIEPSGDENFGCNGPRVAGLLVLAISASLKHEKHFCQIPPRIFSYAAAYFGWISHALYDVLDNDSLLAYLSNCGDWCSEVQSKSRTRPAIVPTAKGPQEAPMNVLNSLKLILTTVKSLWQLVKSGSTNEVLKLLRCCKESLRTIKTSGECAGAVAFAFQYIRTVKLLMKISEHFVGSRTCHLYQVAELDLLLKKLDEVLLALRYRFIGLSEEDELYILELQILNYVLKLSSFHIHCKTLQKLSTMITYVDCLRNTKSIACSDFVNQLAELHLKGSSSLDATSCNPLELKKLCDIFVLKDLVITRRIRHISAELVVPGFDTVSPLRFISGLPVGLILEITLHNVTSEHRPWVKMTLDNEVTEFVFLDVEKYGGIEEVRQFRFTSPFYRTPKAVAFTLKVSIGMECVSEDLHLVKGHGGPRHALTYLSPEVEVYFVNNEC